MAEHVYTRRQALGRAGSGAVLLGGGSSLLAACGATVAKVKAKSAPMYVGVTADLDTLNPLTSLSTLDTHWLVYNKLMEYDVRLNPALQLATSRKVSTDGRTITFTIPSGVKFTDGQPLTSQDIKFTFELVRQYGLGFSAPYMANLEGVDTPDRTTAVIHFSKPPADDPALMTAIVPKHIWSGMTKAEIQKFPNTAMIGAGPFKLKNWSHGQSYTVERNPTYYGKHPDVNAITWIIYKSPESLELGIREGQTDVTWDMPPTIFEGLSGVPSVVLSGYTPLRFDYFGCNTWASPKSGGNPLLKDRVIRQALSLALDRHKLLALTMGGRGSIGTTIIPPALAEWHLPIPPSQQLNNDPARARAMLDAAGYKVRDSSGIRSAPDGRPLRFRFYADNSQPRNGTCSQLIIPMARAIGIDLSPYVYMEDATLVARVFTQGDYDCIMWNWGMPPNPTFMLSVESCSSFHTLSDVYYCNPAYERLFQAQSGEADPTVRRQLVYEAQKIFYYDAAYSVLYYPDVLQPHRTNHLTGWLNPAGGTVNNFVTRNYTSLRGV